MVEILRYADETVLIANSEAGLQTLPSAVIKENTAMNLHLNAKKTECRVVKQNIPSCIGN